MNATYPRVLTLIAALLFTGTSATAADLFDHMKCYQVTDSEKITATVDLKALDPALGTEADCKILRTKFLCIPVAKTVKQSNVPPLPIGGEELSTNKICYQVRCRTSSPPTPPNQSATDQFGRHDFSKLKASLVCAPAGTQVCLPSGPEVCDGADNDCDGNVDNLGTKTCGVGACQRTVQACVNGVEQTCTPGTPGAEACNGSDDDCDGFVDDGLGQTTCGVGVCVNSVNACVNGAPGVCTPHNERQGAEVCDNLDNDCDGQADEDPSLHTPVTCGIGECAVTIPDGCVNGATQVCSPRNPSTELCNTNKDENCNGLIDEPGCTCSPNRANCDGNSDNGCEINLLTDNNNCGACGIVCGGGMSCVSGSCV
jgi:hypothetical protein